jgi:hypothetical protein
MPVWVRVVIIGGVAIEVAVLVVIIMQKVVKMLVVKQQGPVLFLVIIILFAAWEANVKKMVEKMEKVGVFKTFFLIFKLDIKKCPKWI